MSERVVFEQVRVVDPAAGVDEVRDVDRRRRRDRQPSRRGRRADRRPRPRPRARAGRSAHAPAGARRRAQGDGRVGDPGGRGGRLHGRRRRWPTPTRRRTTRRSCRRSATSRRPPARATCSRWARSRAGSRGSRSPRWARWSRPGVRVFSDDGRCVPTARLLRNALTLRQGVPGRRRAGRARGGRFAWSRAVRCTRGCARRRSGSPAGPPRPRRSSSRATSRSRGPAAGVCTCATCPPPGRWSSCGARRPRASASPRR